MAQYRVDTSWKAWRSRMKQAFVDTKAGVTLGFAPIWAVVIGGLSSSLENGICSLILFAWFAGIETFAGARVILAQDRRLIGIINRTVEEGGAS